MNPPYIPATALDGTLIAGWSGPADGQRAERWLSGILVGQASDGRLLWTPARGIVVPERVRLDPRRPEVATRIATVLRARGHEVGHLLPVELGGRQGDVWTIEKHGTYETHRTIPAADVSAVLLAASVAGVGAGRGVVRGVCPAWNVNLRIRHWAEGRLNDDGTVIGGHTVGLLSNSRGWVGPDGTGGPETGPEGRAAADAALLRLGYAYLDSSAPFGVRVPFTSSSKEAAEGR